MLPTLANKTVNVVCSWALCVVKYFRGLEILWHFELLIIETNKFGNTGKWLRHISAQLDTTLTVLIAKAHALPFRP